MADDAMEIRRGLDDRIEEVLDALAPGWVSRKGIAYLTPKDAKNLGSFTVHLVSGKMPRGSWYRFSQTIGGGSVELVSYLRHDRKDAYREAFEWSRNFLGIKSSVESGDDRKAREERQAREQLARDARRAQEQKRDARKKEARTQSAVDVLAGCIGLKGTLGEDYLVGRGIAPIAEWGWEPGEVLMFHRELEVEGGAVWENGIKVEEGPKFPAIVARIEDAFGTTVACWQIYLDPDTAGKAPIDNPKIGRGPASGGAVRLGGVAPRIGLAEGIESSLAGWELIARRYPVWAGCSTSGVVGFEVPLAVTRVDGFADGDFGVQTPQGRILQPPGIRAQTELRARLSGAGIPGVIHQMCIDGDALDLLKTMKAHEKQHRQPE